MSATAALLGILGALLIGAMGFVHKLESAETFLQALREVTAGSIFASESVIQRMLSRKVGRREPTESSQSEIDQLTDRELETLLLVVEADGRSGHGGAPYRRHCPVLVFVWNT
jgi:DNA-binding NarL/FixJ family response regulator